MTRHAFTLIEMLVVVAIIALLSSMLFVLVGWGNEQALVTKNQALLQKVHAGLNDYRIIYNTFPPTTADPLTSNELAKYLCAAEGDVTASKRNSSVLTETIHPDNIVGDDMVDSFGTKALLFYVFTKPDGTSRDVIEPIGDISADNNKSSQTVYDGSQDGFELWAAGMDGALADQRNDPVNADNISVTIPFGNLAIY